ncbi:TPA: DUF853 family protein [Escherichia coli]|nr:DUF853 family protein [Escherichia coli]
MSERLKTHSKTQKKSADLVSNKLRIGVFQRYQMKCKSVSKKSPRYMKDILFGTTGPRGGKKDGVVQTMAKSAARQVTNQIVRGMLGSLLGGRRR